MVYWGLGDRLTDPQGPIKGGSLTTQHWPDKLESRGKKIYLRLVFEHIGHIICIAMNQT